MLFMKADNICIDALKEACMHPDRKLVIHRIWRAMKACLRIIEETKDFMQQRKRNGLQAAIMRSYRNNMHFERHADGGL